MSSRTVHRTARIRLRTTPAQRHRCLTLLQAAGDVWAWLIDRARARRGLGLPPECGYTALCRELARHPHGFGPLGSVGARSVLRHYTTAWFTTANRRSHGLPARFPSRKRRYVPIRCYHGTFALDGRRLRLPVAKGHAPLWVRLARPLPYPAAQVRSVTLLLDAGRLVVDVTAAVPVADPAELGLDPDLVAAVDLGVIHPVAMVAGQGALLVSGRAVRAEARLHLADSKARRRAAARRAPKPGRRGSRRWRRHRARQRAAEARHRRRLAQARHQAAKAAVAFAISQGAGTLVVGDCTGLTRRDAGRRQNWRVQAWRPGQLLACLRDKATQAGLRFRVVDERGSSSTCPECRRRVPKPNGRRFVCPGCGLRGHRDVVGARNIRHAATSGSSSGTSGSSGSGGDSSSRNAESTRAPAWVAHRRAGQVPARRDRRRHRWDQARATARAGSGRGRCGSCLVPGHPPDPGGRRSTPPAAHPPITAGPAGHGAGCPGGRGSATTAPQRGQRCLKGH
jgi:IS605 OrfB family transposase